jgi:Protein of unknown function (DUF2934)
MAKAKKATDPTATKTTRSKKPVAAPVELTGEVTQFTSTVTEITSNNDEIIRQRAYEIYRQRNGNGGSPEEDWFRAEAEILGRSA